MERMALFKKRQDEKAAAEAAAKAAAPPAAAAPAPVAVKPESVKQESVKQEPASAPAPIRGFAPKTAADLPAKPAAGATKMALLQAARARLPKAGASSMFQVEDVKKTFVPLNYDDDEEEKEQKDKMAKAAKDAEGEEEDDDFDPLDAFMHDLQGGGQIAKQDKAIVQPLAPGVQQQRGESTQKGQGLLRRMPSEDSMLDETEGDAGGGAGAQAKAAPADAAVEEAAAKEAAAKEAAAATTISMEDLMKGGGGSGGGSGSGSGGGGAKESAASAEPAQSAAPVESAEAAAAREQQEEEDHKRFMAEWRAQQLAETFAAEASRKQQADAHERDHAAAKRKAQDGKAVAAHAQKRKLGLMEQDAEADDEMAGWDILEEDKPKTALEILADQNKKKDLKEVDHAAVDYKPFRKNLYIAHRSLTSMAPEEVQEIRRDLTIKLRGKGCPVPVDKWVQCGFSDRVMAVIKAKAYEKPFDIQRQAIPAILAGRDVIGIAKTGSGKTIAYLLPCFRHILDQPPLGDETGPIALIMVPARELALQVHSEAKKFCKALGLNSTAVYGGAGVKEQIANLKRSSDIVVATPGRLIDILTMNAGKLVSLARVTFLVLDEADRMFDMGFEPQIGRILANIRPDRQTCLFSATFPVTVEALARKVLVKPIEIQVGGRSVVSDTIKQFVELREEEDKFLRLLQLLGVWYERGQTLVFVKSQEECDRLFARIQSAGYLASGLHGGMEQADRDCTLDEFKKAVCPLMVATSVAGRGLDVKNLTLVINYHTPNHLEDYVHRVGRTGRAGRSGTAYTFISPEEEEFSVDVLKAMEQSKAKVPQELKDVCTAFREKVKRGEARFHSSGFAGKGFTFDDDELNDKQKLQQVRRRPALGACVLVLLCCIVLRFQFARRSTWC
jgi:ATP-dependent RNA helicase DDX46/PRP5